MRDVTKCPGPGSESCVLAMAKLPVPRASEHTETAVATPVMRALVTDQVRLNGPGAVVHCKLCFRQLELRLACPGCVGDPWPPGYKHPRECAFLNGEFSPDNWGCKYLSDLKSHIINACHSRPDVRGAVSVSDSYWAHVTMYTWAIDRGEDREDPLFGHFLVMMCQDGGATMGQAWLLNADGVIRPITLTDIERIFENVRNGTGAL